MPLPSNNFFLAIESDFPFFQFLREKEFFVIKDIRDKYGYKESIIRKHITAWQNQKFVESEQVIPTLGGPKKRYKLSQEALDILDKYHPIK